MIGPLLASGREADVYEFGPGRVLRRYRRAADVDGEAGIMRYLAGQGFPVPEVFHAGGTDLVMERLDGPTLLRSLLDERISVGEGGAVLAGLHRRLHAVPVPPGAPPGSCLLHLDLHPDNVVLTARGPVLIDWVNARPGEADLDLALSALILAQVSFWDHPMAAVATDLLAAFLAAAPGDPRRLLDEAVRFRRGQTGTLSAAEIDELAAAANLVRR